MALALLGTTLLLGACGSITVNPPPATQPTAISGMLVPFAAGSADTIQQQLTGLSAPIASNGNFDLGLPSTAIMNGTYGNLLNDANSTFGLCTTNNVTAPSGFKSIAFTTLDSMKGMTFVAENLSPLPSGNAVSYKAWWFATVAGTVTVNNTGCIGFGSINQSLVFKQGWNVMDVTVNGANTTIALAANQTPGRLTWKNKNDVQSLASQALNPYLFNPWAALRQ
ncbi:hypothetical protein GCM10022631_42740 [Deinococcus rubellus]|uniref:Uncharacterized protein n=1 Tax=Deinococcus rubellus TaxID=1889240 RepID=A0ABY5YJF6_9DEIO|nr:hypothetical protein [Deinococcus rubellus]UWX65249.1 hypothetical protein N0D28_06235 [Deinococcus rubellus]